MVTYRKTCSLENVCSPDEQTPGTLRLLHGAPGPQLRAGRAVKEESCPPSSATSLPCDFRQDPDPALWASVSSLRRQGGDAGEPRGACLL